ncbi:MAG: hypothetical protein J2P48_01615 [Alphaproteobacteria bacterium]|nr:hypothetical protein [Alphaproteobacteria bacterium]
MTYRISYVDTSAVPVSEPRPLGTARTEDYPTEPAALARARELFEDIHCHEVLVSDGSGDCLGGVRLQLKLGLACE